MGETPLAFRTARGARYCRELAALDRFAMRKVHHVAEMFAARVIQVLFFVGPITIHVFAVLFVDELALQVSLACRSSENTLITLGWAADFVTFPTCWLT
jgi:hypothetical protein